MKISYNPDDYEIHIKLQDPIICNETHVPYQHINLIWTKPHRRVIGVCPSYHYIYIYHTSNKTPVVENIRLPTSMSDKNEILNYIFHVILPHRQSLVQQSMPIPWNSD